MAMITREDFRRPKTILGVTALDASADAIAVGGRDITFVCVSGNIWVNPTTTAVANTTAFLLSAGQAIDWNVDGNLSIISDVTGVTYEYILY